MIFRYPGGKSKKSIRERIMRLAPIDYEEYREPFVGGGGIYFSIDTGVKRWINDINPMLMSVYISLRDRPVEFISSCRSIPPCMPGEPVTYPTINSSGKKYNLRLKKVFDELSYNEQCDQSLRYFFINRTVYAGRVNFDPHMRSRMYFSNPDGWNIIKTDKLETAARIASGTKITTGDYSGLLKEDGDNVWLYIDPPYFKDTELSRMSKLYGFGFKYDDHVRLANDIKNCKHKILLSYDDHEAVRELYKGMNFYETSWTYCGTSGKNGKKKKVGLELIITNY